MTTARPNDEPDRKRMPANARRRQMLDLARDFIRCNGASELTLAKLAEACGVTKPIAYQHFGTREALLRELFDQLGSEQEAAILEAFGACEDGRVDREAAALSISGGYIDCLVEHGALHHDIGIALSASGQDPASARGLARQFSGLFQRFLGLEDRAALAFTTAFLGAGEFLAVEIRAGELTRQQAIATLCGILNGSASSTAAQQ